MKGMDLLYVDSRETAAINVIPQVNNKNNLLPGVLFCFVFLIQLL